MSSSQSYRFPARFYDGQSSAQRDVTVLVDDQGFLTIDGMADLRFHVKSINPQARVGNSVRYIELPGQRLLETTDNVTVDRLSAQWFGDKHGIAHLLESNIKVLVFSLVVLLAGGYMFVMFGIPALSQQFTHWLPVAVDRQIAREGLQQLDSTVFSPSKLPQQRRDALAAKFAQLAQYENQQGDEHSYALLFRSANGLGANAFALPDGNIIVTDQLVKLAESDEELLGILLHEIAHVKYRHSMQNLLRQAGVSAIILLITGDVSTASTLVLMLPTVLLQSQYSQEFETESDTYALQRMQELGLDPNLFADTMEKISASHGEVKDADQGLFDYFSTHPPTRERIARFRNAQKTPAENARN